MKKSMLVCLVLLMTFIGQVSMAAPPLSIRFAMEATYPPFEFMNAQGQIEGFDADLAKALCEVIPANCTFTNQPWVSLIPSLTLGKYDALISSLNITADRAKQVAFTDPYYFPSATLVALTNHNLALTTEGLKGKTIGVQAGATPEPYLRHTFPEAHIKTYNSIIEAFLDLKAGRLDGVIADTPIVNNWKKNQIDGIYTVVGQPITDAEYFGQGFAIAVRKDNVELVTALNKALATLKTNGTYDKLVAKYFGP